MSNPISRRGLLGGLLAAAAALLRPSPQPPATPPAAPPPQALPPSEMLESWTYTYDAVGNLVSIDDGLTVRLSYTSAGLAQFQPPPMGSTGDPST